MIEGQTLKKITWKDAGFRAILSHPEVLKILVDSAQELADKAGPGFTVKSGQGKSRVTAAVVATTIEAQRAEAKDKSLTKAIGSL